MRFDIRVHRLELLQTVTGYIERRLRTSIGPLERYIHRVSACLFDSNSPHSEADKCCQITVYFGRFETLIVEERNADPLVAVDRAAERARRTLTQRLRRSRELRIDHELLRIVEPSVRSAPVVQHQARSQSPGSNGSPESPGGYSAESALHPAETKGRAFGTRRG